MNIIYDADGMIIIKPYLFSVALAEDYGISTEKITPFFLKEFQPCVVGNADLKEVIKPFLFQWGWKGTVDELLEYWFKTEHCVDERVVDHIKELRMKGHKCYLGTNQEKYRIEYMKKEMRFKDIFDGIFVSCEIGFKKPSEEFYNAILEKLGNFDKRDIIIWDDTKEIISTARGYGFKAELYIGFEDYIEKMERVCS